MSFDFQISYSFIGLDKLNLHQFDDAYLIYDRRSGHTQALNEWAWYILELFMDNNQTVASIISHYEKILEEKITDQMRSNIVTTVKEFDRMGFIYPV